MAIQLGSAYGKVSIDSSGVTAGVGQIKTSLTELGSFLGRLGSDMQTIGAGMTIAISAPLILAGKAAVDAANNLNDAKDRSKVVFGDMADDMLKWSKGASDAFGMSQRQALDAGAQFGELFRQMGLGIPAADNMSKKMVELARDISTFNGEDVSTVLTELQSGLVGRGMDLKRLGVDLSQTAVTAKALAMGLGDANGKVSDAAMVQARYKLILEGTTRIQGMFAASAKTSSGELTTMKAKLEDTLAAFGERMIPIVTRVVDFLNKLLDFFTNLPGPVQDAILVIAGLFVVLGPIIGMIGSILGIVSSIVTFLLGLPAVAAALTAVAGAIGGVVVALVTVVLPIILIIGAIALLYFAFKTNFGGIRTTVEQLWFIIKYEFQKGWESISNWTKEGASNVSTWMKGAADDTKTWFSGAITWLQTAWKNLMDWLSNMAAWGRNAITSAFHIDWAAVGSSIINGIINGFKAGISWLVQAATNAAQAALAAIKTALGISSPSRKAFELGMFTGQGYTAGLAASMDPNMIAKMVARPIQNINGAPQFAFNLADGVTLKQMAPIMAAQEERIMSEVMRVLTGYA